MTGNAVGIRFYCQNAGVPNSGLVLASATTLSQNLFVLSSSSIPGTYHVSIGLPDYSYVDFLEVYDTPYKFQISLSQGNALCSSEPGSTLAVQLYTPNGNTAGNNDRCVRGFYLSDALQNYPTESGSEPSGFGDGGADGPLTDSNQDIFQQCAWTSEANVNNAFQQQGIFLGTLAALLETSQTTTVGTNREFDSAYVFSVQSLGSPGALGSTGNAHSIGPGNNCLWRSLEKNDVYFVHTFPSTTPTGTAPIP